MKNLLFLVAILITCVVSLKANQSPEFEIILKSGNFTPEPTSDLVRAITASPENEDENSLYRLIQFYEIPTTNQKKALRALGIELLSYLPNKAFFCRIHNPISRTSLETANIRSIFQIENRIKLSPLLIKDELPSWAISNGRIKLSVKYFSSHDKATLEKFVLGNDGAILGWADPINVVYIDIDLDKLIDIANNTTIQWIEPVSPAGTPEGTLGKGSTRANALNTNIPGGRKYDGTGVVVALSDDGVIGPHIDFEGRVTLHTDISTGNHGDMTSGIFVGAGNIDPDVAGMAPGADINIYKQGSTLFLSSYLHILNGVENMNTLGTVVTSTSFSQGQGGIYTTDTEFTDDQIQSNPNIIHVLSAGNSGTFDHGYGAGAGWANISGGIKAGKNVICAGNVTANDELVITSSRGPAADGRIKPDLCSQGDGFTSTDENNEFQPGSGTSASAPAIAGVLTQLYQAYKELNGGQEPETGLLKAALLNTAEDLGNPGPDFKHGWGRINGLKAVRILEDNRYLRGSLGQSENLTHSIEVPENVSQVKVMTYWMDVGGNPNAGRALVNDINMEVITPNEEVVNPLILDPTPVAALLNITAFPGIDNLNNMEQVSINNPVAGQYTVNVNGFAIPEGPQNYFVLYEFIFDDIELTYPLGGEGFVPNDREVIRWDASNSTENFSLEFSTDGGNSFNPIIFNISNTSRSFNWTVPEGLSNEVIVKLTRASQSSESGNLSILERPENLRVLRVCPDTIEIGWDIVEGVDNYEVSMLGAKYMDAVGVTDQNSFKIAGLNPNESHWFSVRSIYMGSKGKRAIAIQQEAGTVNCVLENDIALLSLLYPFDLATPDCRDVENTRMLVNMANLGSQDGSQINLNYQVNNGQVITETLPVDLPAGDTINYTFDTSFDFSDLGEYDIRVWANFSEDQNFFNDTLSVTTSFVNGSPVTNFPYSENFQSFANCDTAPRCNTECELEDGWLNFKNLVNDELDWRTDVDGTFTTNTGPTTDYDLGTSAGKYLYMEGTEGCNFQEAIMLSPCIDLTDVSCATLEFAYHMFGVHIGELHIDIVTEQGEQKDVVPPIVGSQGEVWKVQEIDLAPYVGDIINLKITGSVGGGSRADIALDAFSIQTSEAISSDFAFENSNENTILFTNNSTGEIDTYLWDFGDGNSSAEADPEHIYDSQGTYEVTLIVSGPCGTDTFIQSINVGVTSAASNDLSAKINIYPNPTRGTINIELPKGFSNYDLDVNLVDVLGKQVGFSKHVNGNMITIEHLQMSSGVVILELLNSEIKLSKKVVVQK